MTDVSASGRRRLVVVTRPDVEAVDEFVSRFDDRPDVDVEVVITESEDEVDTAVANATEAGVDAVVSVGGDGSLNLLAAALVRAGSDVPVLSVAAGTVNLVNQLLGPDSVDAAVESFTDGTVRTIDLGETEAGPFVMNASMGYDAATIADADDHSDATLGRFRFLIAGVKRLRKQSPIAVRVTVDGRHVFDGPAMSVIVMNIGRRVSDSFEVAPDASFDDGVLDVMVVKAATVPRFAAVVWRLIRGKRDRDGEVVRAQGDDVRIQWAKPVAVQRDGDADDPVRSLTARCLPNALRLHHG